VLLPTFFFSFDCRHNLKEEVRESLYDQCRLWMNSIKSQNADFCGGKAPNMADLAVYGVLNSIEGCEAFKDALENTQIGTWYSNMKNVVSSHNGSALLMAK